jgi:hypothetical protein
MEASLVAAAAATAIAGAMKTVAMTAVTKTKAVQVKYCAHESTPCLQQQQQQQHQQQ